MHVHRSLGALCAVISVASGLAGCFDPSVGPVVSVDRSGVVTQINDPVPGKCQALAAQGVRRVFNQTGIDIVLHGASDCTDPKGQPGIYVATLTSASAVVSRGLWHSFSTVGQLPPVSP